MGKDAIINSIKANQPKIVELQNLQDYPSDNLQDLFIQRLMAAGGDIEICDSLSQANNICSNTKPKKPLLSCVDQIASQNINIEHFNTQVDYVALETAVVKGSIGVAENGAIWVNGDTLKHRGILHLAEHLIIILELSSIVPTMLEAYRKLALMHTTMPTYGVFISGPSKTADIEQSLVIGAHGPRSCKVIIIK